MTVVYDIVDQDTLTGGGTVDTLRTGAGSEFHAITFTNYSGSDATLELFVNGTADVNRIGEGFTLQANGGVCIWKQSIGSTDTLRARAGAATAIVWIDEMTTQT